MTHPTRYTLWVNKQIEVCTDPLRRCYNGAFASSEMRWTGWQPLCDPKTLEDGEDTMATFQRLNPTRKYKLTPPGDPAPTSIPE